MLKRFFPLLFVAVLLPHTGYSSSPDSADHPPRHLHEIKTGSPSHPGIIEDYSASEGFFQTRLGLAYIPEFNTGNGSYKLLYGDTGTMFNARVDYYFFDWFATLGIGTQLGYYRDSGFAYSGGTGDTSSDDVERDQKTDLVLIPWQLFGTLLITPFQSHKWISLNAYMGIERMYVQETRVRSSTSGDGNWYIKGYNDGALLGFAANFRLDPWNRESQRSLRSIGISKLFMTLYLSKIEQKRNYGDFSREEIGLQFTFESH